MRSNLRRFEVFKFNTSSVNIKISWGFCETPMKTTCVILNINAEGEEFSEISKKIMDFLVTVQKERPITSKRTETALSVSHSSNLQSILKSQQSKSSQKACQLRSDLKKQKEERILKRKTAIQKIEDDLLEEESNLSEEVLEQFDTDFPTKEKVQDWMKQIKNLNGVQERQDNENNVNGQCEFKLPHKIDDPAIPNTKLMTKAYRKQNNEEWVRRTILYQDP
jgi:hypothetical protein